MGNFLTDEERFQLRKQHKMERDKRICDRIKAVLLYDDDWTLMQIAEALLITDEAVRQHVKDYRTSKKLKPDNGGSVSKLSKEQEILLEKHLQEHVYLYVKNIVSYVQTEFQVEYSVSGMRHWLLTHNFSHKKPAIVPGKANLEQQKKWIEEYDVLKQNLPKDETVCFTDGVHPTHNTQVTFGWIKKGVRKEVCSNTGRKRLNLTGLIDVIAQKLIVREDQTLNTSSTIAFFKLVEKAYPQMKKVHVFCDNARYYRNKEVQKYLQKSKIELHFLPPYSPNLNPIERLWKWMKERVTYNTYYPEFDDFKEAIFGFLQTLSSLNPRSELAEEFSRRVGDRFRPMGSPHSNS